MTLEGRLEAPPRFQAGGALSQDALYVRRPADEELPAALLRGEFCYVLAPRQIGKSSLRVRARDELRARGVRAVSIDLTTIGSQDSTAEQWYFGMLRVIAGQLGLPQGPERFWEDNPRLSPVHRWSLYLREVVLSEVRDAHVVIFIDEIDAILSLPGLSRDDFFAAVRAVYNARADEPECRRLTFCLFGVALPGDLSQDPARTPFNVGRGIVLEDFTQAEMDGFLPGLQQAGSGAAALLRAIYDWTGGHPYMTQRICQALCEGPQPPGLPPAQVVDAVVSQLFLRRGILEAHLADAERRTSRGDDDERTAQMLRLYRGLRAGERVPARGQDPVQLSLRLTGMAAQRQGPDGAWLQVRNRVFAEIFDDRWVRDREMRRLLSRPLQRWLESGRREDLVLSGERLEAARAWAAGKADLSLDERAFVQAGEDAAERRRAQAGLMYITVLRFLSYYLVYDLLRDRQPRLAGDFYTLVYLLSLLGGLVADGLIGARRAVLWGTCVLSGSGVLLALSLWAPGLFPMAIGVRLLGDALSRVSLVTLFARLYRGGDSRRDQAFLRYYFSLSLGALLAPILTALVSVTFHGVAEPPAPALDGPLWGLSHASHFAVLFLLVAGVEGAAALWFHRQPALTPPPQTAPGLPEPPRHDRGARSAVQERLQALLLLSIINLCFWVAFDQSSRAIEPLLLKLGRLKVLFLLFLPSQSRLSGAINALFAVALAPVVLLGFSLLHRTYGAARGDALSSPIEPARAAPAKMWIGVLLTAVSLLLLGDVQTAGPGLTIFSYCVLTLGELCLVPMQIALVSWLAPSRWTATFLGLFLYWPIALGGRISAALGPLFHRWPHEWFFGAMGLVLALSLVQLPRLSAALPRTEGTP